MIEPQIGQRVEVIDGPLAGTKATIVQVDGWIGHILIRFDRESEHLAHVPIDLLVQWFEVERLKASEP